MQNTGVFVKCCLELSGNYCASRPKYLLVHAGGGAVRPDQYCQARLQRARAKHQRIFVKCSSEFSVKPALHIGCVAGAFLMQSLKSTLNLHHYSCCSIQH